jgi:hypothetical protein
MVCIFNLDEYIEQNTHNSYVFFLPPLDSRACVKSHNLRRSFMPQSCERYCTVLYRDRDSESQSARQVVTALLAVPLRFPPSTPRCPHRVQYHRRTTSLLGFFFLFKKTWSDIDYTISSFTSAVCAFPLVTTPAHAQLGSCLPRKPKCCLASVLSPIRTKALRTATPSLRTKTVMMSILAVEKENDP